MKIEKASINDCETVLSIVYKTVLEIYPNYYPSEVVDFFLRWHNPEVIGKDIEQGFVYLVTDHGQTVATGTSNGKYIGRVYVLPEFQGNGYGAAIMNALEEEIIKGNPFAYLEASLPSYEFYLKRGYKPTEYHRYEVENKRVLCYYVMEKELGKPYDIPLIIHDEDEEQYTA